MGSSEWPKLKTGVIAQYPVDGQIRTNTRVIRFVDGSEQRYQKLARPLRSWLLRYSHLDLTENAVLDRWFVVNSGAGNNFTFTDLLDGRTYTVRQSDQTEQRLVEGELVQTEITVEEEL